ncbi:MAG TPA: phosphohistidine phosphatase SixA [Thermomicrobiales bacterium]|nr:phosphohistidine phosphatase SixA [Thermomicrobiales bacterium]
MELYLLRHGEAVARGPDGTDESRPLIDAGRAETRQAAGAHARLGVELDLILTSPLVRAQQTASLVAEALRTSRGPEVCMALGPGGRPEDVLAALLAAGPVGRALLVGHMPGLGRLAGWLAWGRDDLAIPLRTAGLCRVDLPPRPAPGAGDLRWLLPPRVLRELADGRR